MTKGVQRGDRRRRLRSGFGQAPGHDGPRAFSEVIVVDASAAVDALLRDSAARRSLEAERAAAPHLIDAEVMQALRGLAARDILDGLSAHRAVRRWRNTPVQRFAIHGLVDRVWAMRHNLSAYDACYVALAEALGLTLVTADQRLASAPGLACPVSVVHH